MVDNISVCISSNMYAACGLINGVGKEAAAGAGGGEGRVRESDRAGAGYGARYGDGSGDGEPAGTTGADAPSYAYEMFLYPRPHNEE